MASTYLQRTQSAGNRKTYTFSAWVKRSNLSSQQNIFGTPAEGEAFGFTSGNQLYFYHNGSSGSYIVSNALFRDSSAWYHLVVMNDTSQATASNRVKIYVNGEQITSFSSSTYPAQDSEFKINQSGQTIYVGQGHAGNIFDGSMAHVHFIDGTAYDASAFGETDSTTGIWEPKTAPSVTYGTNGFFLKFASSGSMGTDSSGNGNDFTVGAGNLTQTQDTPSNVFATWNSNLYVNGTTTFSNGNTKLVTDATAKLGSASTFGVSSGKWYCEMKAVTASTFLSGVSYNPQESLRNANHSGFDAWSWGYYGSTGEVYNNNSQTSYGSSLSNNDIVMIAMDLDNSKLYFGINGTWQNSGVPTSGSTGTGAVSIDSGETYFFEAGDSGSGTTGTVEINFGNGYFGTTAVSSANSDGDGIGLFEYEVPSGYYALCTKNINTYG